MSEKTHFGCPRLTHTNYHNIIDILMAKHFKMIIK